MRFPYTRIDPQTTRPYVSIILRSGFATTDTLLGLVDSGADYSILPLEFAATLRLNAQDGRLWTFRGTTGRPQIAYIHPVEMSVWDTDTGQVLFRFNTEVSFAEDFQFPIGMLLGQTGFLSKFSTTFNQPEHYFDLDPFDSAIAQTNQ